VVVFGYIEGSFLVNRTDDCDVWNVMYLIYRGVGDPSTDDPGSWKHCGDSML
jgi:hypothetical protein